MNPWLWIRIPTRFAFRQWLTVVLQQPTDYLFPFEEYQFSIGLGVRNLPRSGKLVQIAS